MSEVILDKLDDINARMDLQEQTYLNQKNNKPETIIVTPATESNEKPIVTALNENGEVVKVKNENPFLTYKNTSAIVGFNVGEVSSGNVGIRMHYDMRNTNIKFRPEAYVGFGQDTNYGATANLVYNLPVKSDIVKPYIGAGLGFAHIDDNLNGNYNFIVGTHLPFLHKSVYVDYISRNGFENNQIAIGYHLPF